MPTDSGAQLPDEAFLRIAASAGLDTSDTERMADLQRRVTLMREGLARVFEIDGSDAEPPSAFVPVR